MISTSLQLARDHVKTLTGISPDDFRVSTEPLCGMDEEFFFTHNSNPNYFVYIAIADGQVITAEMN